MLLYLVRHGIAIDREDPNCPSEPERHLTPKGETKTRDAAAGLARLGIKPRGVLSSPYLRALQTAEIFCHELGISPAKLRRTPALLPMAAPAEVFRELKKLRFQEVICFGHAPNLDEVIAHAVGTAKAVTELKKAGAACVVMESSTAGHSTLAWVLTAKQLRKLA